MIDCARNIFRKGAGKPVGCLQSALTDVVSISWFSSSATCSRSNNNLPVLLLTYWLAHMYLCPKTDSTAENNQQKVSTFINPVIKNKGAFQKSELASRTMAGPDILAMKKAFSKRFCWKNISFVHNISDLTDLNG